MRPGAKTTDFYPRSPCGERPGVWRDMTLEIKISIHALLAESDKSLGYISDAGLTFLSTLSLRRATSPRCGWLEVIYYFYPRSPCGERLYDTYAKVLRVNISIHALLAESDSNKLAGQNYK